MGLSESTQLSSASYSQVLSRSVGRIPSPPVTNSTSAFESYLPSNLWRRSEGEGVNPAEPALLSSAAQIVARQRLVEQLQEHLLLVSERSGEVPEDPINLIVSSSPAESVDSTEALATEPGSSEEEHPTDGPREENNTTTSVTYFSTLRELLADLITNNELRLVDDLSSFSSRNLNMLSDDSDQSDEASSSMPVLPRRRRAVRPAQAKTFTISENEELKKSYSDLMADIRSRCGLSGGHSSSQNIPCPLDRRKEVPNISLVRVLKDREQHTFRTRFCQKNPVCSRVYTAGWTNGQRVGLSNQFLPNKKHVVDLVKAKTFCIGYTDDGMGVMTASQDHKLRLYTSRGKRRRYMLRKMLDVPFVGWSILDVAVSPDGKDLVYSTWNDAMFQCNIHDSENNWIPLRVDARDARFALFSLRFNFDGTEIVGGSSDEHLYIYNREVNKCVLAVKAHEDDVNAVCFGDHASHIILSGGDDGLCKVWDRRTMGDFRNAKPAGVFAGHRDGIVFIDSRGDDRYILTNCKDQTVKVWDLRHFGTETAVCATKEAVAGQKWDYRWQCSPIDNFQAENLRDDCSLVTLRGHSVLHTLIRARFSPDYTGKRFIYTGCGRGSCVVYDFLTNEICNTYAGHSSVTRDVVWHPHENELITSSWDGKTFVWRPDERAVRSINPDNSVTGDEDSCDENYEPIRKRFLRSRQKLSAKKKPFQSPGQSSQLRDAPELKDDSSDDEEK